MRLALDRVLGFLRSNFLFFRLCDFRRFLCRCLTFCLFLIERNDRTDVLLRVFRFVVIKVEFGRYFDWRVTFSEYGFVCFRLALGRVRSCRCFVDFSGSSFFFDF